MHEKEDLSFCLYGALKVTFQAGSNGAEFRLVDGSVYDVVFYKACRFWSQVIT